MVDDDVLGMDSRPARILIVEDNVIQAMDLAAPLEDAGYDIVGPAPCLSRALELIRTSEIDAALLDIGLEHSTSYPAAEALMQLGVPFAFLSGFEAQELRPDFEKHTLIDKPVAPAKLRRAVRSLLSDFKRETRCRHTTH